MLGRETVPLFYDFKHYKEYTVISQHTEAFGKVADFSKDFIFSMNFDGKSYWEKMLLGDMLNQGLKLYPEYKQFLLNKYGNDLMWSNKAKRCNFMNRIIFIPRKLIMKLKFYLSGPLAG